MSERQRAALAAIERLIIQAEELRDACDNWRRAFPEMAELVTPGLYLPPSENAVDTVKRQYAKVSGILE